MTRKVLDFKQILNPEYLASQLARNWITWDSARNTWLREKRELRNYIFATDTTKTTNSQLPWKNTTTLPKICQIRDNLHSNYMAALFPHEDWFDWYAMDREAATMQKKIIIKAYMRNKLNLSAFKQEVSKLVLDYIDYGNAFAEVVFINEYHTTPDGQKVNVYTGPKLERISPFDMVFDITASSFKDAPKIKRTLMTVGQLVKMAAMQQDVPWIQDAIMKGLETRKQLSTSYPNNQQYKFGSYMIDGFGDPIQYFKSGMVELLEFEGDYFDVNSQILFENRKVIIIDRAYCIYDQPYTSWLGTSNKEHVGWRLRPDNVMAMGPLDNLVGLQYRLDHLENLKADVFDQIAHPVVYQKGFVEDWEWGPGERIYGDTESDVKMLVPDSTALNADMQIERIENQMEDFAGAPKSAMGIRTPGEKTAYEVQTLDNAAGRIFQSKITHFEEVFLEPLLNQMLEVARRNFDPTDLVRIQDPDIGALEFQSISQDDIKAKGKLIPMGARHFARKAQLVQNLNNFVNSAAYADPAVSVHISGLKTAQVFEELLEVDKFQLVQPNVRIFEQQESQALAQTAQDRNTATSNIQPQIEGLSENDMQNFDQMTTEANAKA